MDEEINKLLNKTKAVMKDLGRKVLNTFLPIILIITFLAASVYYITVWADGKGDDDWSGTPYGAGQYSSNVTLSTSGELKSSMTAKEVWDKMVENGSRVNLYLDNPEELLKLMNAEIITQFPDVREDPTKKIDWDAINKNIEENKLQGIIKFKRADWDGNEPYNMSFAEPYLFDAWLEDYNSTGSEESKKKLLNYFTIRENTVEGNDSVQGTSIVVNGKVADVTKAIIDEITKKNTYGLSGSVCQTWVGKAYAAAGFGYQSSGCCAYLAGKKWGVSSDFSQIVSGAAVWTGDGSYRGTKSCSHGSVGGCGHAGIYYKDQSGNDWVMHFYDKKVHKDTLEHWLEYYGKGNTPVWGWQGGITVVEDGSGSTSSSSQTTSTDTQVAPKTSYYVDIATWSEVTDKIESNDPDQEIYNKVTPSMTTTRVNYQDLVSGYTMPFDYLWSMLVITEDKDFVLQLADLVYNSEIEITVHDNLTTNTNTNVYTYTKNKKTKTKAKVTVTGTKISGRTVTKSSESKSGNWTNEEKNNYKTTYTTITKTNTLDVSVTLADVWMAKYTKDYTYEIPDDIVNTSTSEPSNIDYPEQPSKTGKNDTYGNAKKLIKKLEKEMTTDGYSYTYGEIDSIHEDIYFGYSNRKENITNTTHTAKYGSSPMVVEEKTDKESEEPNFVTIFLDSDNTKAKNNILSVESWLFELLENHDSTKDTMVDLTKYLLYKATGTDFGITEYDFSAYGLRSITTGTGGLGLLNLTSTTFTKEEFVSAVQSYSAAISKGSGTQVFRDNAGVIYDVCVKNNINPILCAAQAWKEQNWDDPNTSPFNFWGIAVYNGQNYGNKYASMENGVEGYCKQINSQISGNLKSTYQARATEFASVNSKFKGDMSTIYDVFAAYAYIGKGHTLKEEADYAANYVEAIMKCASQIFGEGALEAVSYGASSEYANASATEKVKWLFPNGIPQSEAELLPYLTTINVPVTGKNGNKFNMGVQVHKAIAQDVYNACFAAQQEGFKIYSIGGYRKFASDKAGKAGGLQYSQHCYGLAVDINPTENGQFINGKPTANWFYDPGKNQYSIKSDSALVKTFKAAGWGWGADWRSSKDYMHFSFCGT